MSPPDGGHQPSPLSDEELAKIKERADADHLTTWPTPVLRLLVTIESRDQRIKRLVEVAVAAAAHFDLAGTHTQADVEDRFFDLNRSLKAIQPGDLDV